MTFWLRRVKNCISRLCITPCKHVRHYWWEQLLRIFHTGLDRPWARRETAKDILLYPSRHMLSQHPHLQPLEWVPRGHYGHQIRRHSKSDQNLHKLRACLTPLHTNPMEPGHKNTFSAQNRRKTKRFVIFDPKRGGGVVCSTFFNSPHQKLPHTPKRGFQVGGGGGGPDQKMIGGFGCWTKS